LVRALFVYEATTSHLQFQELKTICRDGNSRNTDKSFLTRQWTSTQRKRAAKPRVESCATNATRKCPPHDNLIAEWRDCALSTRHHSASNDVDLLDIKSPARSFVSDPAAAGNQLQNAGDLTILAQSSAPTVPKRAAMSRSTRRRSLILQEWDRWIGLHRVGQTGATRRETLEFYLELRDANSPLLNFNSRGRDKWEIVHSWLITAGRVQDNDQS
jgi:hypothetical protein